MEHNNRNNNEQNIQGSGNGNNSCRNSNSNCNGINRTFTITQSNSLHLLCNKNKNKNNEQSNNIIRLLDVHEHKTQQQKQQEKLGSIEKTSIATSTSSLTLSLCENSLVCCTVCQLNQSRYTCPKCYMQYCSSVCYKKHSITCTELFWERTVKKAIELDQELFIDDVVQSSSQQQQQQQQQDSCRLSNSDQINQQYNYYSELQSNNIENSVNKKKSNERTLAQHDYQQEIPRSTIENALSSTKNDGTTATSKHQQQLRQCRTKVTDIPHDDLIQLLHILEGEYDDYNNDDGDDHVDDHVIETKLEQFLQSRNNLHLAIRQSLKKHLVLYQQQQQFQHPMASTSCIQQPSTVFLNDEIDNDNYNYNKNENYDNYNNNNNNNNIKIVSTNYVDNIQEWILDSWHPWWRPELTSQFNNHIDNDEDDDNDDDVTRIIIPNDESYHEEVARKQDSCLSSTLLIDERLLSIPTFDTIRPRNKSTTTSTGSPHHCVAIRMSSMSSIPELQYNLIDIIHSYCCLVRIHHGPMNCIEQSIPIEIIQLIYQTSAVLGADARYTCIEEVLLECTRRSAMIFPTRKWKHIHPERDMLCTNNTTVPNKNNNNDNNNANMCAIILEDVACICTNHRYVARSLFEFMDIVQGMKKKNNNNIKNQDRRNTKIISRDLTRYYKKIEYYLSWSRYNSDSISTISYSIQKWIHDWMNLTT